MSTRRISVAIVAMGGQGGGVLADWLRDVAEQNHWIAQNTSVPGVAQRTGATIYYIELIEPNDLGDSDKTEPVMALMPVPGDVDLVIASEWMETGRAIMRGLVTPDKTTLIASTHREYATTEKIVPGNGVVDPSGVAAAAKAAAKKLVAFDLSKVATDNASVISASLLGATAASGALPFDDESFENAIKNGGVGVKNSLNAFRAGRDQARDCNGEVIHPADQANPLPTEFSGPLAQRIKSELPEPAWPIAFEGVRRCVDYLDADYANEYLDRIGRVSAVSAAGAADAVNNTDNNNELISEVSRWLALRMCYEDPIRVADLKLRASRFDTIRSEVNANAKQLVHHTEYLHPRVEEIADSLPEKWGSQLMRKPKLRRWVDNTFCSGKKLRTTSVSGHIVMHWLAQRSGWRRQSLRHQRETSQIDAWISSIARFAQTDPQLASATARLARLIKGYGDTHSQGTSVFTRLSGVAEELATRPGSAAALDAMIDTALANKDTAQLDLLVAQHKTSIS